MTYTRFLLNSFSWRVERTFLYVCVRDANEKHATAAGPG
jgi:hypothetical protein